MNMPTPPPDLQPFLRPAALIPLVDLTTLSGDDTGERVRALCAWGMEPGRGRQDLPPVAAVCVHPGQVAVARRALGASSVRLASVVGGFPDGQLPLALKRSEAAWVVDAGADELDLVIHRGRLLEGEDGAVRDEVAAVKECAGERKLKVILETGALPSVDWIQRAAAAALEGGADFLKTSTGRSSVGATPAAVGVLLESIQEWHRNTGRWVGCKVSGGVRTLPQAQAYAGQVAAVLGTAALCPQRMRIGASTLLDALVEAVATAPRQN